MFIVQSYSHTRIPHTWTMSDSPVIRPEAELEHDKLMSTHRVPTSPASSLRPQSRIAPNSRNMALAARFLASPSHWTISLSRTTSKDQTPVTNFFLADVNQSVFLANPASQAMTTRRDPGVNHQPNKPTGTDFVWQLEVCRRLNHLLWWLNFLFFEVKLFYLKWYRSFRIVFDCLFEAYHYVHQI